MSKPNLQVGSIVPLFSGQENKIAALEKRDGLVCHYCQHPLARFHKRCTAIEYHAEFWWTPEGGDQRPGHYPVYESFLPAGCKPIELDHKTPRSKGGSNKLDNLVLACPDCNARKSDRYSYEEFTEARP